MICIVCGKETENLIKVEYVGIDYSTGNNWISYYCLVWNAETEKWNMVHRGIINETKNMSEGNIVRLRLTYPKKPNREGHK